MLGAHEKNPDTRPSARGLRRATFILTAAAILPYMAPKKTLADRALGLLIDGRMIDTPDFQDATATWRLWCAICATLAGLFKVSTFQPQLRSVRTAS